MKKFVTAVILLLMLIVFVPVSAQAISIANVTTVFQGNFCFGCNGIGQFNRSVVRQNISFSPKWFIPKNHSLLMNTLSSIATINQSNVCQQCSRVLQSNATVVVQKITTPKFISALPGISTTVSSPTLVANLSNVAQGNLCIECNFSKQINSGLVSQNITLLDPVALRSTESASGSIHSLFSNFTRVQQLNFCVFCKKTLQSNLAFVVQNISATPEPGTLLLLGSGLAGLYGIARKKFV